MKVLLFFALALIEYIVILFLTNKLTRAKEYVTIKYSSFEFSTVGDVPYGLNILIMIVLPTIFIVTASGIFYKIEMKEFVENIFLITVFYYLIRWFFIVFILNRKSLYNWKTEFAVFAVTITLNLFLYYCFILQTEEIFVSVEELRDSVWIAIIFFVIVIIRDYIYKNVHIDNHEYTDKKKKYILTKYKKFENKYNRIIKTKDRELKLLTYSIMIYEDFNRPKFIRYIEILSFLFKRSATLGIMQYKTNKFINDEESVKLGYRRIKNKYFYYKKKKRIENEEEIIIKTISAYYGGRKYYNEVSSIYAVLNENL